MDNIRAYSEVAPSRGWLVAQSGNREVRFAFPPVSGTHSDCYKSIAQDKELVPAEGLDLALLAEGAYTQKTPQWQSVRSNFINSWARTPNRVLLIPTNSFTLDKSLSGILVEKDLQGIGFNTAMQVPDLSSGWTQNELGIYVSSNGNAQFVPSSTYEGKSFEQDGIAHAHLTPEGAEIFARTARNNGLITYNRLEKRMSEITSTEQWVSLLGQSGDRLDLAGNGDGGSFHAFEVSSVSH
ncbi:MAG: hypothetical protein AABX11_06695 [Nanoarchaeota archaeon]